MFRNLSLKIVTAAIVGCLILFAAWTSPAGAMIFPDLLSLVRVDIERDTLQKSAVNEEKHAEAADSKKVTQELYVVKNGDTLWALARKYSVDWKKICYANNLDLNGVIRPGQELTIPLEGTIHVVKSGESLWEIARKYEKDMDQIMKANDIANPKRLKVGTRLVIPEGEAAATVAALRPSLSSRYEGFWRWPLKGTVTSVYGPRGNEFHHGLDIAADTGEKIYPIRGGRVEFCGWLNDIYGRTVIVDHGEGIRSLYAHNSKILIEEDDRVNTSTPISEMGSTGKSTGPHLHLEVYVDGKTIDPQRLLP